MILLRNGLMLITSAALLAVAAVAPSAQATNLLTNPGFETGDLTGWTLTGNLGHSYLGSGFAIFGTYGYGNGAVGSLGLLSQTITTAPNATLDISGYTNWSGGSYAEFDIILNGVTLLDLNTTLGNTGANGVAQLDDVTGTGSPSGSNTITFGFRDDPNEWKFDNASVTVITTASVLPEPASLALLGAGLFGLATIRRRR